MTDLHTPDARVPADPPPPRPRRQERDPASDEVVEVAPGVLRLQLPVWMPGLGHVNTYALVDDRGVALVDPGLPGPKSWLTLKRRLRSAGFRLRDVHTVLVTHSHPDHYGGAGRLQDRAGAQVVTHRAFTTAFGRSTSRVSAQEAAEAEQLAAELAQSLDVTDELPTVHDHVDDYDADPLRADPTSEAQVRSRPWGPVTPWGKKMEGPSVKRKLLNGVARLVFAGPEPTRRVVHRERLRFAGREWWAIHTPGHTVDHLCLYDPEHGVLLTGDHVLPSITPHIAGVPGADALHSYLQTLDLVAALDGVRLALPAHGHPFEDLPGRVDAIKRHHQERMEHLREVSLAIGPASVEQLSHELFPRRHWGVMAQSETFAHLEHLVGAHEAERWEDHGVLIYRAAASG